MALFKGQISKSNHALELKKYLSNMIKYNDKIWIINKSSYQEKYITAKHREKLFQEIAKVSTEITRLNHIEAGVLETTEFIFKSQVR